VAHCPPVIYCLAARSKEAYKLAKRMAKRSDQVLYFSIDPDVDWTNNSCEPGPGPARVRCLPRSARSRELTGLGAAQGPQRAVSSSAQWVRPA
jgi:hypothetical protein